MPVPHTEDELLRALTETYGALTRALQRVPAERAREASLPGHRTGTRMSPADLVAYLIGWNELVVSWHDDRARGIEPQLPAPGFTWNQLGSPAQKFYRDHADVPWPQLLQRLDAAHDRIVALVRGLDNGELYGAPWYRTYTAGRMIQLNTSSPYTNARRRLRTWLRADGL